MSHKASRYHDFSYGHRVVGHENKCRHLHGHNGRVHFHCEADPSMEPLDKIGRVIDFGEIKSRLCMWIENNWDHKFLAWDNDPVMLRVADLTNVWDRPYNGGKSGEANEILSGSIVWTPFNPTAENMAEYLVRVIGPQQLEGTGIILVEVKIEETAKCHASFSL